MDGIRGKILLTSIGGLLFTSAVSTLAIQVITRSWLEHDAIEDARAELDDLADDAVEPLLRGDQVGLDQVIARAVNGRVGHTYAVVLSADRRVLASSFVGGAPRDIVNANPVPRPEGFSVRTLRTERGLVHDVARGILGGEAGELHLGIKTAATSAMTESAVKTLLVIQGGSLALAILACFILAEAIVRPIHRLLDAVQRVGRGDLAVHVGAESTDEVGGLQRAFDAMVLDLRRARSTLEEMATHAQAIVASFPNALFVTDGAGKVGVVNPAAPALVGVEARELVGSHLADHFVSGPERKKVGALSELLRRDGPTSTYALSIQRKNGAPLAVHFTSAPMLDASGRFHGFVVEVSDLQRLRRSIEGLQQKRNLLEEQGLDAAPEPPPPSEGPTPLHEAETHLVRSDRLVSIGQLAASVAHEINNPLFAMMTCAKVLERDLQAGKTAADSPRLLEGVRTILEQSERCKRILRGLLDYGRVAAPRKEPLHLKQVAQDVRALVSPLAESQGVRVSVEASEPDVVLGDAAQLHQVVLNLAMNSVQAMPAGGRLELVVRPADEGRKVELVVRDTGVGIPPENLKKVWEPFFTTKEKGVGTGLGLSIAKGIVSRHGGTIVLASEVGKGTEIAISLPADRTAPAGGPAEKKGDA